MVHGAVYAGFRHNGEHLGVSFSGGFDKGYKGYKYFPHGFLYAESYRRYRAGIYMESYYKRRAELFQR